MPDHGETLTETEEKRVEILFFSATSSAGACVKDAMQLLSCSDVSSSQTLTSCMLETMFMSYENVDIVS